MAEDGVAKDAISNPCCSLWIEKHSKLQQTCGKLKNGRAALKQSIKILEEQIALKDNDNQSLKKACEEERVRAENEREGKEKESGIRVSLEVEVSDLKSQILLLQKKADFGVEDGNYEVIDLKNRLSEAEIESKRLNELLEKEKTRADTEKKRAEIEEEKYNEACQIANSEKIRADKERVEKLKESARRIALEKEISSLNTEIKKGSKDKDLNKEISRLKELLEKEKKKAEAEKKKNTEAKKGKKAEEYKIQVEKLKTEVEEAKSKLALEMANLEEEKSKLVAEKQKASKEKKKADAETAKAEKQKKLAEANMAKALEEKEKNEKLQKELVERKQLDDEEKQRNEKLQRQLEEENQRIKKLQKQLDEKSKTAKDQRSKKIEEEKKIAEESKAKATEGKNRADELARQLNDYKQKTEELQKVVNQRVASLNNTENAKMKLLRKKLKFERSQLKHAKEVAELEKGRCKILQHEVHRLKEEFFEFSDRLKLLDGCFSPDEVGKEVEKNGKKTLGAEQVFPTIGGALTESISGIDSQLVSLLEAGTNRNMLKPSCGLNSSLASVSDRPLIRSQERSSESAKIAEEKSNLQADVPKLAGENTAVVAENNVRTPLKPGKKRKRMIDVVASVEQLHMQLSENLAILHGILGNHSKPEDLSAKQEKSRKKRKVNLLDFSKKKDNIRSEDSGKGDLGILDLTDGDYKELFKMCNSDDERIYRSAIERPLSPLPEKYFNCIETLKTKNKQLEICIADENFVPPLQNQCHVDTSQTAIGDQIACVSHITETVPKNLGKSYLPRYCVVFSDISDCSSSVSKIFCFTRTCLAQCPVISDEEWVVKKFLLSLSKIEGLLLKEKVCVLFSLLLHNFSRFESESFANFSAGNFKTLDSFAGHVRDVMSDSAARSMFSELCSLDDLLALIEDFLRDRRVMVYNKQFSDSTSIDEIPPNYEDRILSVESASTNQLVAGAILAASLYSAIDRIGFICEASCNILRVQKVDSQVLTFLHVFAHICGPKYLTLENYDLIMTAIKSLIATIEGASSCTNCPFSKDSVCMDLVVKVLLENLQNAQTDINLKCGSNMNEDGSALYHNLEDILFLLELVACQMSWDWTCDNVVPQLLNFIDSSPSENLLAATIIILGQLGRLGVEAKGYGDSSIQNMRDKLSAFLSKITLKKSGLSIQVATVSALLGVISLNFEELMKNSSNSERQIVVSNSTPSASDYVVKWFSALNKEQQSTSSTLLSAIEHKF